MSKANRTSIILIFLFFPFLSFSQDLYDINSITTIELTFQQSNWDQLLDNLVSEGLENRLIGSVAINGVLLDSVGVRYKGNSSYQANQVKNPLNIKLDHIINNQNYEGYGTIKLANVYKDPTFIREVLSYEMLSNYMPASKANFAKVYINGTYIGLYTSVQSVDKFFIGNHFSGNDNTFIKGEVEGNGATGVWTYLGQDSASYPSLYELESDYGWNDLIQFLDVLNNSPQNINNYLNVDRHLWMLAWDILCVNLDAPVNFAHNYYLYLDNNGRFNPVVWDMNENFGIFSHLLNQPPGPLNMTQLNPFLNLTDASYPIIAKILSIEEYRLKYLAHFRTIMKEMFESDYYYTRAIELQAFIDSEVQNDPNKFYTYANFQSNLNSSVGTGPQSFIGITELMDARVSWLNSQQDFQYLATEISNPGYYPAQPLLNSSIIFTAESDNADEMWLYYRTNPDGIFIPQQMFDDGSHNDGNAGDGAFGTEIFNTSTQLQYYYYSKNLNASYYLPERAEYEFFSITTSGDIVINEFMAANTSLVSDQDGEYDDWIELYNNSNSSVNLSGYYLSDDASETNKWAFPDTTIGSGNYLIIWADKDSLQEGLHCNFKLSASGETILLSSTSGGIIDEVSFGNQSDDISTGRYPNGTGNFVEMLPSFEEENNGPLIIEEEEVIEEAEESMICYPNPFYSSTTIKFNLIEDSYTELKIYNLTGQEIFSLVQGFLNKGDYEYNVDLSKVPKGIYLCSILTNNKAKSIKLISLK